MEILTLVFGKGSEHGFSLFKNNKLPFSKTQEILADKGYQGIKNIFPRAKIPYKKSKNTESTQEQRDFNKVLGKQRVFVEHINRYLKRFRILSGRYRKKRKKSSLRVSLIAGIYNFQST